MLYREITAICSQIHTKYINILCVQNVELLNVKLVVPIVTAALQRAIPVWCWILPHYEMWCRIVFWLKSSAQLNFFQFCCTSEHSSSLNLENYCQLHGVTFRKTNLHSHRCDNLKYCRDFNIAGGKGVQIPDVLSPRQLNLDDGATHLWIFSMETASCHFSGAWNFDVVARYLENILTLDVG
jgi:hypothetical protein